MRADARKTCKWRPWRDCVTLAKEMKNDVTPTQKKGWIGQLKDACKIIKIQWLLTIWACSSTVRAGDS